MMMTKTNKKLDIPKYYYGLNPSKVIIVINLMMIIKTHNNYNHYNFYISFF